MRVPRNQVASPWPECRTNERWTSDKPVTLHLCETMRWPRCFSSHCNRALRRGQLLHDGAAVQPRVLAADEAVAELPHVQETDGDASAMAPDSEKCSRDRAAPLVLGDTEILPVVAADRDHLLGCDVANEVLVEVPRGLSAVERAVRRADDIVFDILGVHGHSQPYRPPSPPLDGLRSAGPSPRGSSCASPPHHRVRPWVGPPGLTRPVSARSSLAGNPPSSGFQAGNFP